MIKRIIRLSMVGLLIIAVVGCTAKETTHDNSSSENQSVTQEIGSEASSVKDNNIKIEKSIEEIDFEGRSLKEIKNFIDENKEIASPEDFDKMIVLYDQKLRNEHSKLSDQYLKDPYISAIYEAIDKNGKLRIENITDKTILEETLALLDVGYSFTMAEGEYYLTINYESIYNTYAELMSERTRPYYELMYKEFIEDYWNVSFLEVKDRAEILEMHLKNYPNSPLRDEEKEWLTSYIIKLFQIDVLNGSIDYDTGLVDEEIKIIYDQIIESDLKVTKEAILEMMAILEANNFTIKTDNEQANNKINLLREKYTNETSAIVDKYYPVQ